MHPGDQTLFFSLFSGKDQIFHKMEERKNIFFLYCRIRIKTCEVLQLYSANDEGMLFHKTTK